MANPKNSKLDRVYTVEECAICGYKLKRDFKDGDYVLKESGVCPKCNKAMVIKYVFAESPPK
ncbi:MAG: hypothetical protein JRN37_00155 [Nitrososphaerota archaeon]|jgi:hypothetical protein|nr:hypothetical protein [Nitrososphaerota archaeon]MDG7037567.1 hypothetical protein [Nitrososphaerota archaeon]MDG7042582.1 hypothetical protein [Nitrososphaerota archaeon]